MSAIRDDGAFVSILPLPKLKAVGSRLAVSPKDGTSPLISKLVISLSSRFSDSKILTSIFILIIQISYSNVICITYSDFFAINYL